MQGPGRELQLAAFAQVVLENHTITGIRHILILCPPIKTEIWSDGIRQEFRYVDSEQRQLVHDLWEGEDINQHVDSLKTWARYGGVGIIDYDVFQRLDSYYTEDEEPMNIIKTALFNPGPNIVFFDYESIDKKRIPKMYPGLVKIRTTRRLVLPELVSFLSLHLLGPIIGIIEIN